MSREPKMSDIKTSRIVLCHHSALKRSAGFSHTMYLNESTDYLTTSKKKYNKSCILLLNYLIPVYSIHFTVQKLNNLSPNHSQLLCLYSSISLAYYFFPAPPRNTDLLSKARSDMPLIRCCIFFRGGPEVIFLQRTFNKFKHFFAGFPEAFNAGLVYF